ncbi:MAG TPA: ABC transporter ATP-binding protein [Methanocella sp.]|nr:ABC transporter ATP-binding protein [Methanocella sp.]
MKEVAVELAGVEKKYGEAVTAVKGLSLRFYKGEWTMIMGPSGSGKTTLLNMISCLDRPTSGKIFVLGQDLGGMSSPQLTEFRRNNLGQIFQQYHLIPYLNALENVMVAQYFHSVVNKESALEALKQVGLEKRLDHVPSKLSGGEQQRVAIARALINEPSIVLADEPTGNLDRKNGELIMEILKKLHARGQTIIFVTHNPELAEWGDRIVELADGTVVSDREVIAKEAMIRQK